MRILIVASRYLPHRGGLETVVQNLAKECQTSGHEVFIVTNRFPRTLQKDEQIDGLPVRRLHFLYPRWQYLKQGRFDLFIAGCLYFWLTTIQLYWIFRQYKPDVINLHYLGSPGLFLWLLHITLRFPMIVSLHGGDVDGEPNANQFSRWLFCSLTSRCDMVTACSRYLADQAIQLSPNLTSKIRVIYNGVNWDLFAHAPAYPYKRRYIAAVGQLIEHKGFDLLIEAFGDIAKSFPDVDLFIAGDGRMRSLLAELVEKRKLFDRVILLGRVDELTVASLMAGSLFVAMPSRREPFGIVALEAVAAGKQVLATPVGGIPEFLAPDTNRLVLIDRSQWAKAIAELIMGDKGNKTTIRLRTGMQEQLSWKVVAAKFLALYTEVHTNSDI